MKWIWAFSRAASDRLASCGFSTRTVKVVLIFCTLRSKRNVHKKHIQVMMGEERCLEKTKQPFADGQYTQRSSCQSPLLFLRRSANDPCWFLYIGFWFLCSRGLQKRRHSTLLAILVLVAISFFVDLNNSFKIIIKLYKNLRD